MRSMITNMIMITIIIEIIIMIIITNMIIVIIVIMIILIKPDQGWHWLDKLGCKGANSQAASDTELWIQV